MVIFSIGLHVVCAMMKKIWFQKMNLCLAKAGTTVTDSREKLLNNETKIPETQETLTIVSIEYSISRPTRFKTIPKR